MISVNKHNKLFSAHQHIAVTVCTSYDCWKTDGKINGFITWEQTGSDALPALQQLWGQRLLSAKWSLTGLGGNLSEGDPFLDRRVAEGVSPATELRGIWVVLKVTGWSLRWGVTRRVALQGEQIMNRVSDELGPTSRWYCIQHMPNTQNSAYQWLKPQIQQGSIPDRNKQYTEIWIYNLQVSDKAKQNN